MREKLNQIKEKLSKQVERADTEEDLSFLEKKYLGRKGELTQILRSLKDLEEKERKDLGGLANQIKQELESLIAEKRERVGKKEDFDIVDVTLPGEKIGSGHLNPITIIQNEIEDVFTSLGFLVVDGPELESDYYCFEALNVPKYHPARDMQDTFYVDKKNQEGEHDLVMRTHTSPVQVRAMEKFGAPLRVLVPGRSFRNEDLDACHEHTFYQVECLMIDRDISIANFRSVVKEMLSGVFKQELKIRLRPGFFPFVEPGFEIDISCTICGGQACPSCKNSGWLEVGGAGMVHPNVLTAGGVNPDEFSGFAFGFGMDRIAMMKFGINDIRLFNSGDLRFLNQF